MNFFQCLALREKKLMTAWVSKLLKSHKSLAWFQGCYLPYQQHSKFVDTGRAAHSHKHVFSQDAYAVHLPFCCINISIYLQPLNHTALDKLQQYTYHAHKQIKCKDQTQNISQLKATKWLQEYIKLTVFVQLRLFTQFPIHTATTMLPVYIPLQYRDHSAQILISTLFLITQCNIFIFSGNLLYDFMSIMKMLFSYADVVQSETQRSWLCLVSYLCIW